MLAKCELVLVYELREVEGMNLPHMIPQCKGKYCLITHPNGLKDLFKQKWSHLTFCMKFYVCC